jgi:hypothetical protein
MTKAVFTICILLAAVTSGCAGGGGPGIMQADPADPAGSASTGTGSVTSNSMIPQEAKAAGIGLGP